MNVLILFLIITFTGWVAHADISVVVQVVEPHANHGGSPIIDLESHVICHSPVSIQGTTVEMASQAGADCSVVFPASSPSPTEGNQVDSPIFVCPGNECYIRAAHRDHAGNTSLLSPEAHALHVPVDTEPPATTSVLIIKSVMPVMQ